MARGFQSDLRTLCRGGGCRGCGRGDHPTARRWQGRRADGRRVRAVDGAAGQTGDIGARRLDRAEPARRCRRLRDAAGQGHHLVWAQRIGRAQPVETRQFIGRDPDPRGDIRDGVSLPGDGHLIVRIRDDAARIRRRAVGDRLSRRLGGVERVAEIAAHVKVQRPVTGRQQAKRRAGQDQVAQRAGRGWTACACQARTKCAGGSGTALFGHLDFLCPAPCGGAWLLSFCPALRPVRGHPSPVSRAPDPRPEARTGPGATRHSQSPCHDGSRGSGFAPCRTVPPAKP